MRELTEIEIDQVGGGWSNIVSGVISGLIVDFLSNGSDSFVVSAVNYMTDKVYVQTDCYSNF